MEGKGDCLIEIDLMSPISVVIIMFLYNALVINMHTRLLINYFSVDDSKNGKYENSLKITISFSYILSG